jgi:hypothetical protein
MPCVGRTAIAASASVFGVPAATTFHYRTVAVNAAGTKYGLDMTFKTP